MNQIFPYANIVTGVLVLIVGFLFHWVGQLISLLNWELATKIGLQEKEMLPAYKVYEHAFAIADVTIGWIYGIAGIGLILGTTWGFKLAWFPGVVMVYHSISMCFWTKNQRRAGHQYLSSAVRVGWLLANGLTGILAILFAWSNT